MLAAGSGPQARRVWRMECHRIDLLLTDIVMPEGTLGIELAQLLQAEKPALKVIFTSGYRPDIADKRIELQEGINFLARPYLPPKLAQIIRKIFDSEISG